jgi:hypothetical protein
MLRFLTAWYATWFWSMAPKGGHELGGHALWQKLLSFIRIMWSAFSVDLYSSAPSCVF